MRKTIAPLQEQRLQRQRAISPILWHLLLSIGREKTDMLGTSFVSGKRQDSVDQQILAKAVDVPPFCAHGLEHFLLNLAHIQRR